MTLLKPQFSWVKFGALIQSCARYYRSDPNILRVDSTRNSALVSALSLSFPSLSLSISLHVSISLSLAHSLALAHSRSRSRSVLSLSALSAPLSISVPQGGLKCFKPGSLLSTVLFIANIKQSWSQSLRHGTRRKVT